MAEITGSCGGIFYSEEEFRIHSQTCPFCDQNGRSEVVMNLARKET